MTRPAQNSTLDLDAGTREALELAAVLEWIAEHARTAPGARRALARQPTHDPDLVRAELERVEEVRRFGREDGWPLPSRLPDPTAALSALDVAGLGLGASMLRDLARVAAAAGTVGTRLAAVETSLFPRLAELGATLADLRAEAADVIEGTDPAGRVLDSASPELASIRQAIARVSERLRAMLERLVRDPDAAPVIRDDFVTQRNRRFVVPVRTDAPRPLAGIVHGTSSSGATQFIEPLESVEMNNELMRLAEAEREEEERILLAWSDAFRIRLPELVQTFETLTRLDEIQARALFAEEAGASAPRVEPGARMRLRGARHPLLERRLRSAGERCVPLDLELDPADRVLVISGPNTGGKTVALKTVGLLALMGQSGVPVPADDAVLPVFRQVRADIGDHQSIAADLSTFSAHVGALVALLDRPRPPALFLIDEIGTGTEPGEGAALAEAVLESLQAPGITTVVTTHLGALKSWAVVSDRALCAAMEFDPTTLRPTYRLRLGIAGVSAGLDIAERLGMPRAIVDRARGRLSGATRESEGYLSRLRDLSGELEARLERLDERERELAGEREHLAERAERERETLRREAGASLDRALEAFSRAARRELDKIEEAQERRRAERAIEKGEARAQREHARLRAELAGSRPAGAPAGWVEPSGPLEPGQPVFVCGLGREGRIAALRGATAEVHLGGMTLSVERGELRVPPDRGTAPDRPRGAPSDLGGGDAPRELRVIGLRVEEAVGAVERFLDAAMRAGHSEVRIVHGHGTGRLRSALRRHLAGLGHVMGQRPGGPDEGGDGVTIVAL